MYKRISAYARPHEAPPPSKPTVVGLFNIHMLHPNQEPSTPGSWPTFLPKNPPPPRYPPRLKAPVCDVPYPPAPSAGAPCAAPAASRRTIPPGCRSPCLVALHGYPPCCWNLGPGFYQTLAAPPPAAAGLTEGVVLPRDHLSSPDRHPVPGLGAPAENMPLLGKGRRRFGTEMYSRKGSA